jgi:hypothetical protein
MPRKNDKKGGLISSGQELHEMIKLYEEKIIYNEQSLYCEAENLSVESVGKGSGTVIP